MQSSLLRLNESNSISMQWCYSPVLMSEWMLVCFSYPAGRHRTWRIFKITFWCMLENGLPTAQQYIAHWPCWQRLTTIVTIVAFQHGTEMVKRCKHLLKHNGSTVSWRKQFMPNSQTLQSQYYKLFSFQVQAILQQEIKMLERVRPKGETGLWVHPRHTEGHSGAVWQVELAFQEGRLSGSMTPGDWVCWLLHHHHQPQSWFSLTLHVGMFPKESDYMWMGCVLCINSYVNKTNFFPSQCVYSYLLFKR